MKKGMAVDPGKAFFDLLGTTPGVESIDAHLAGTIVERCGFSQASAYLHSADPRFVEANSSEDGPCFPGLAPPGAMALAIALASARLRMGHVFLDLRTLAGRTVSLGPPESPTGVSCPGLEEWLAILSDGGASSGESSPLVVEPGGRVYLRRYWEYEEGLAQRVRALASWRTEPDPSSVRTVNELFADAPPDDLQRTAAMAALERRFLVIAGGPGTGKTTTVARLLASLLAGKGSGGDSRIVLAAPTGKAAARLQESIAAAREALGKTLTAAGSGCEVLAAIPDEASTLHRLIGQVPGTTRPRRDAANPIPAGTIIVDEASMVDLAMMSRLFHAVPEGGRLILLGDPDQLASVEAGSVLRDLCEASSDFVVTLTRSRRFVPGSGIGELAGAVNRSDLSRAIEVLESPDFDDVSLVPLPGAGNVDGFVVSRFLADFAASAMETSVEENFAIFGKFRILSAMRNGPFGAVRLNEAVVAGLRGMGLAVPGADGSNKWYNGRPVMVTGNDYGTGLFNGDVGIALAPDPQAQVRIHFQGPGGVRSFIPAMLPTHETAYAMTIHKSQGSEFDTVAVFLPDRDSRILNRELLYTAITRARKRVVVVASVKTLAACMARSTERATGLAARLNV